MKTAYSCAELAAMRLPGMPTTAKAWYALVAREGWPFETVRGSGGREGLKRLYTPPPPILKLIRAREAAAEGGANPAREQLLAAALVASLADFEASQAAAAERRTAQAEAQLRDLACLSGRAARTLQARTAIAEGWSVWFAQAQPLVKSASWAPYAEAYNARELPIAQAVREVFPRISARSAQRWVSEYRKGNLVALVDRRNGDARRGQSAFTATPLLAAAATKLLLDRPGIRSGQLCALLKTAAIDRESGALLFTPPSFGQVYRFHKLWIAEHRELYLQATHPDAWKNQCLPAYGSCSEDVTALNGRWEMDATPADWLLLDTDGRKKRHTVSVIVDVWSRRMLVVVARTPKTVTHCLALRLALLSWGVPGEVLTDNGQDYQSEHFKAALAALSITHLVTAPFSPEEKPHVERAIGTLNHSILELLPHFVGHSVAERQAIEARRSFAERLARKGELVDVGELGVEALTAEALQAQINTWISGVYEPRVHAGIGVSPRARAASWSGEIRRIGDERSLDILLARPADGGQRTLQKKGLRIDGTWFIAPELARIDTGSVVDVYETPDLGRVVVYHRGRFLCIAEAPERTGADRQQLALAAARAKRDWLRAQRAEVRARTKGLPGTDELLAQHLADQAKAAGQVIAGEFGQRARAHDSAGLIEAGKAAAALAGPVSSARARALSEQARAAMAAAPKNVTALPSARVAAHATPLEGISAGERYALWCAYDALVAAHGGDLEALEEGWQRRFLAGYPKTNEYKAQATLAGARKENRGV